MRIGCSCCGCGTPLQFDGLEDVYAASLLDGGDYKHKCTNCETIDQILNSTEKERVQAQRDYPGPRDFVHLHNHSIYSELDGVAKPEEYMEGCDACGLPAFAITDHGSMAATPDAYFSAKKHKIKFIPGCEVYLNDFHPEFKLWREGVRDYDYTLPVMGKHEKLSSLRAEAPEVVSRLTRNRHLTIIAKNAVGYTNLLKIQNLAHEVGYYKYPRVWYDLLKEHKEGLIIFSGCLNGPLCHELREEVKAVPVSSTIKKRLDGTSLLSENCYASPGVVGVEWIMQMKEDFGDDFYLELQMPGESIPNGKKAFRLVAELGRKLDVPAIITNDCHYIDRSFFEIQLIMMAVRQKVKIDDPNLFHVNSDEQFFKTRAQLRKGFIENKYTEYATIEEFEMYCDNTLAIAEKCENFDPDLSPKLPEVDDSDRELTKLTFDGLKERGLQNNQVYVDRVYVELGRFFEKGFSSYFLICRNLVKYSKDNIGPVGPARGSAGGSLVCYLLGIHDMDPIKWGLSFDRFLSESRGGYMLDVSM